ncbi:MAG: hypothetical protein ACPHY8_03920 [Patescibacteria group bacterium]
MYVSTVVSTALSKVSSAESEKDFSDSTGVCKSDKISSTDAV